jgi:hypothetical protein
MPALRIELEEEYERYSYERENNLTRKISRLIKTIVIKSVLVIVVIVGTAFVIANFAPEAYTKIKDTVFETVDIEQITGRPDSVNKKLLDTWLIVDTEPVEQKEMQENFTKNKIIGPASATD